MDKFARECEEQVRTLVIQAVEKSPGTFELNIKKEHLIDNVPPPGTPLPKPERKCGKSQKQKT